MASPMIGNLIKQQNAKFLHSINSCQRNKKYCQLILDKNEQLPISVRDTCGTKSLFFNSRICSRNFKRKFSNYRTDNQDTYSELYNQSLASPADFWGEVASNIPWMTPFVKVLDDSNSPFTKWFVGGQLNTCYNAVDQHVDAGLGDKVAIIYDSPITGQKSKITFKQLQERVAKVSGMLSSLGVTKGDVVMVYMSMIPEAIIAMLATVRLGAVHSVVFGGFAAPELATRINHCEAKIVMCSSVGIEPSRIVQYKPILDEAVRISAHKPKHCIIFNRNGFESASLNPEIDIDWKEAESKAVSHDCVPVDSSHPAYILYTSGTTGSPKGIVRPTGGHAVVLPWTMKTIYDINKDEVWWAASDLGWVVGHSYICYAPLLNGNTTVLYEGKPAGTPDSNQFFRVIKEYGVKGMFTAPTALRAIAKEKQSLDPQLEKDVLRYLYVAGEPLDNDTREWAFKVFSAPVLDNWWQTETGFAIAANCPSLGMDVNPPKWATGKPIFGFDIKILNEKGEEVKDGTLGRIVSKLPLPPCNFNTLWRGDDRFKETYFEAYPGYYDTMDAGIIDEKGYVSVQARDDDVINVAGHLFSTIALEEAIMQHKDVHEAAVIGVPDNLKGEVPLAFFVPSKNCNSTENELKKEIVTLVRNQVGPVAAFRLCASVSAIPKTRSGKIPRKTFASLAKNKAVKIPPTIEDPTAYKGILTALRSCGFALDAPEPS